MSIPAIYSAYGVLAVLWFTGLIVTAVAIRWPRYTMVPSVLSMVSVITAILLVVSCWTRDLSVVFAGGGLMLDGSSAFVQVFILTAVAFCLLMVRHSKQTWNPHSTGLMLLSASGLVLVSMSYDLVALLAGLTVALVPLLGIAAINRSGGGREAALKGLVLYSIGACFLGLGTALLASRAGTTTLSGIGTYLGQVDWIGNDPVSVVSIALVLCSLGMFLAVVPFHMLSLDLAEGLPSPASLLFAGGLMTSGMAAFLRVILVGFSPVSVSGPGYLSWVEILHVAGIMGLVVGNSMALVQRRLRRLIACLLSGQVGLVLVAMAAMGSMMGEHPQMVHRSSAAILVFLGIHVINWSGLFLAVSVTQRSKSSTTVGSLQGLARAHPWLATSIGLSLLCMAGMPLTAGFFARLYLMESILSAGWIGTAIVVALSLGLVLVMSLGLVVAMFMRPCKDGIEITVSFPLTLAAWSVSMVILVLGVWPGAIVDIALSSTWFVAGM